MTMLASGCRTTVPIHVWSPSDVEVLPDAKVALAPLAGDPDLARRIEREMLIQRPAAKADVALFTADQLAERSPIRLASTAELSSDLTAVKAAQAVDADLLLHGEIMSAHLMPTDDEQAKPESKNMNEAFFQRLQKKKNSKNESLLLSWRVIDTKTARTLGSQVFSINTAEAKKRYPDLAAVHENETDFLIAASARESWKSLAPVVTKAEVRLSNPWFQPGAWRVRRGVAAAKRGQWELAEEHWQTAADGFRFNAAAQHNLALALAAREDFPAAKQQIMKARGPLAIRLPHETLFWLDQQHRNYHRAHGLPAPEGGWAFPEPVSSPAIELAPPRDVKDLPWWTAIPFAKPPDWTWRGWLTQPVTL